MEDTKLFYKKFVREHSGVIDRIERLSEIIFGVIMTLTFTGVISIAEEGMESVRLTLWAALGCNTAWGIIDGMFYLMNTLYDRGRALEVFNAIRHASTKEEASNTIRENITPIVAELIPEQQVIELHKKIVALPEPPKRAFFVSRDFLNALIIFFIVFLSTFPMALPLFFIDDAKIALRTSNAIGLTIMFIAGCIIGRKSGYNAFGVGMIFALIGAALVFMTIQLGG